jgi:putative serine protease PepD
MSNDQQPPFDGSRPAGQGIGGSGGSTAHGANPFGGADVPTSAVPTVNSSPATAPTPVITSGAQPGTPGYTRGAPETKKRSYGLPMVAGAALAAALIGGGVGGAIANSTGETTSGTSDQPQSITITNGQTATAASAVATKASPSVVTIGAISGTQGGSGSGIVLDKEGHILTNAHVVTVNGKTNGVNLQVKLYDNRIYKATLVGTDPLADLAVIKVDAPNLQPATLGDSSKISVGDMAVVIGSPLGLSGTVTDGIISTKSRTIALTSSLASSDTSTSAADKIYVNVIQTDAALNHGNSGGALVDGKGNVIGVNVAIASTSSSSTGGDGGNSGIGFAIPINGAKRVADSLIKDGKASHGYLGVQVKSQQPTELGTDSIFTTGAVITQVLSGSPADKAGLKKGDVITAVDELMIEDSQGLTAAVRTYPAGQKAKFTVTRDGKTQEIDVTLGDIPSS